MSSFALDKWYLDLVTDDGTAVVGYVVGVHWHGVDLRMAARLEVGPTGHPVEHMALGDQAMPHLAGGCLSWTSDALGLRGEWRGLDAPITRTLLASASGNIEWSCVMPRARATVVTPSARHDGLGYAERLRLTLPPWALPFKILRWGRHVSDRHALVWIEWEGHHPLRAAWLDGEPQPAAHVVTSGIDGLSDQRALRWHDDRDLTRRSVVHTLAGVAPALAVRVAGRLAGMQEHKQLSPSALVDAAGLALDAGWAMHEVVTW